ncbi:hypothetical protein HRbin31_00143 [bacterium HR31]|nr:hypothetical protein HRbin31_00143 [bacterium HR31]
MSRWLWGTVLAVLLSAPGRAGGLEVVARAASARRQAAYAAEQLLVVWEGERAHSAFVHVQHDPAVGTRLSYRPVGSGSRRVVWHVRDRTVEYDPRTRAGRSYRNDPVRASPQAQLSWLERNYALTWSPTRVLGRDAVHVRVTPRRPGRPRADLRVDRRTGVILRSERVSPDGRNRELAVFLNFVPQQAGWMRSVRMPDDLHLTQEPAAQAVTESEAAARLGQPLPVVWLPPDFSPLTEFLVDGRTGVARRLYSDGLTTLVLSFRRAGGPIPPAGSRVVFRSGGPVWVQSAGLRHALHWANGGWAFTLVGELSPDVLLEVADRTGVQPAPSALQNLLRWLAQAVGWADL